MTKRFHTERTYRLYDAKKLGSRTPPPNQLGLGHDLLGLDLLGSLAGSLAWLPYMCTVPARTHRRPEGEKDTTMPLANLGPAGLGVGQRQRGAPHLAGRLVCVHCLSDMGFGCSGKPIATTAESLYASKQPLLTSNTRSLSPNMIYITFECGWPTRG